MKYILVMAGAVLFLSCMLSTPRAAVAQTQASMNAASGKSLQTSTASMNAAYKKLWSVLNSDQRAALKKSQTAWTAYSTAEAAFLSSKVAGGSIYPTVYAQNLTELTDKRTKQLKKAYKLFTTEGDM